MTLSESSNVIAFLEEWQSLISEASLAGLTLSNDQQVILLLAALPPSWRAFVSTQGSVANLSLADLISNILQEYSLLHSNDDSTKSMAFYSKNKSFNKFRPQQLSSNNNKNNHNSSFKNVNDSRSKLVFCHYCGKPNHKSTECRKRLRDRSNGIYQPIHRPSNNNNQTQSNFNYHIHIPNKNASHQSQQVNGVQDKEPIYLFIASTMDVPNDFCYDNTSITSTWYLDSGATQHMTPNQNWFLTYEKLNPTRPVCMGDDTCHQAIGQG